MENSHSNVNNNFCINIFLLKFLGSYLFRHLLILIPLREKDRIRKNLIMFIRGKRKASERFCSILVKSLLIARFGKKLTSKLKGHRFWTLTNI